MAAVTQSFTKHLHQGFMLRYILNTIKSEVIVMTFLPSSKHFVTWPVALLYYLSSSNSAASLSYILPWFKGRL
jgi:hypothetical protein